MSENKSELKLSDHILDEGVLIELDQLIAHIVSLDESFVYMDEHVRLLTRDVNMMLSFVRVVAEVLEESGIVSKRKLFKLVTKMSKKNRHTMEKGYDSYKASMVKDIEHMKKIAGELENYINSVDIDGLPIAKA